MGKYYRRMNMIGTNKLFKKECYFCGRPAQFPEHAPPKQMFKRFNCDSITVPSCNLHNNKKSGRDQAIIHGFFKSLIPYQSTLSGDILTAFRYAEQSFRYTKRTAVISKLLKHPSEKYRGLPSLAYLPPDVKMIDWIRQLTAAIIYSGIQSYDPTIDWKKIRVESPEWIHTNGPESVDEKEAISRFTNMDEKKKLMAKLTWKEGWSAYPRAYPANIYRFCLHFSSSETIMNHIFYSRYYWYAWIPASQQLIANLESKISEQHAS